MACPLARLLEYLYVPPSRVTATAERTPAYPSKVGRHFHRMETYPLGQPQHGCPRISVTLLSGALVKCPRSTHHPRVAAVKKQETTACLTHLSTY